jgi:hypothetical protein
VRIALIHPYITLIEPNLALSEPLGRICAAKSESTARDSPPPPDTGSGRMRVPA